MKEKFEKNKRLIISLLVIVLIISIGGGSLAYFFWEVSEEQKTLVNLQVPDAELTITGENISHTGMYPTDDCDGEAALIGEVATVTAVNGSTSDMEVLIRLRASLSVASGHGVLDNSDKSKINWALIDISDEDATCSTTSYKGTLSGATNNTDIDTDVRFIVPSESTVVKQYRLYVWLDASYEYINVGDAVTDPMENLSISVKYSPASEMTQNFIPNAPVLDAGMIPVKISADGVVTTVSQTDPTWYNYSNKEWANVVLVNRNATSGTEGSYSREYYKNNPGTPVLESDILAYYVWIPRYKYRIAGKCLAISNPTLEKYPECYSFILSESDKITLVNWAYNKFPTYIPGYTIEKATEDVEQGLENGIIILEQSGYTVKYNVPKAISTCNSETEASIIYSSIFKGEAIPISERTIDIVFEPKDVSKSMGDAVNTYYTHPAFLWDGTPIAGIWVGKFETSHSSLASSTTSYNLSCTNENCTNADGLIIKPNVQSLRSNNISNKFYASRSMTRINNPFGLSSSTTDSHMMKNSEWGVVAYLSHSAYGINSEIRINNNSEYITGCGASEENRSSTSECQIAYGSGVTSYPQSTTGNITGIFDMSGGASEHVMGWYSGANSNYATDTSYFGWTSSTKNEAGFISDVSSKYWDNYTTTSTLTACNGGVCFGHALSETSGWYSETRAFVSASNPWLERGGYYSNGAAAGAWNFGLSSGNASIFASFRSIAIVGA